MISLKLTNRKAFMKHLLLAETFDHFLFIEGEITTFNKFSIDGYLQKDFFKRKKSLLWNLLSGNRCGNFVFPLSKENGHP